MNFAGTPVASADHLLARVSAVLPGSRARVIVLRDGRTSTLDVEVEFLPSAATRKELHPQSRRISDCYGKTLGMARWSRVWRTTARQQKQGSKRATSSGRLTGVPSRRPQKPRGSCNVFRLGARPSCWCGVTGVRLARRNAKRLKESHDEPARPSGPRKVITARDLGPVLVEQARRWRTCYRLTVCAPPRCSDATNKDSRKLAVWGSTTQIRALTSLDVDVHRDAVPDALGHDAEILAPGASPSNQNSAVRASGPRSSREMGSWVSVNAPLMAASATLSARNAAQAGPAGRSK